MTEFTTKDSGERKQSTNGMQRDTNEGKARFDLLWPKDVPYDEQFMTRIANLMARGAAKYDARNWEKGTYEEDYDRAMESAERHFNQYKCGDRSEDHAAGVFFNLLAAVTYEYKHGVETRVAAANEDIQAEREQQAKAWVQEAAGTPVPYHHHDTSDGYSPEFIGTHQITHKQMAPHVHGQGGVYNPAFYGYVGADNHCPEPS
jgi:hypothetical protein